MASNVPGANGLVSANQLYNIAAKDGTTIVKKSYGPGKDGSEVVLIVIESILVKHA